MGVYVPFPGPTGRERTPVGVWPFVPVTNHGHSISLQVRSLISARGKGVSGVLHEAMSSRGTTGNTQVQSPLNATTATGKETQKLRDGEGGRRGGRVGCPCVLGFIESPCPRVSGRGTARSPPPRKPVQFGCLHVCN